MKTKIFYLTLVVLLFTLQSCGHKILESQKEAIEYIESHKFSDDGATITGSSGGQLKSGFSISFSNGKAEIGNETLPYTIEELSNSNTMFSGNHNSSGYLIKICGSERYAYGGCINCFLSSGLDLEGKKKKYGPFLLVDGTYIHAYFSNITDGAIKKK